MQFLDCPKDSCQGTEKVGRYSKDGPAGGYVTLWSQPPTAVVTHGMHDILSISLHMQHIGTLRKVRGW